MLNLVSHAAAASQDAPMHEIVCAMADARRIKAPSKSHRVPTTERNFYHLAAMICLQFRGRKLNTRESMRVILDVLEAYIKSINPDGIDRGLEGRPFRSFVFCYLAAHHSLGVLDEPQADAIFKFCDENLGND